MCAGKRDGKDNKAYISHYPVMRLNGVHKSV